MVKNGLLPWETLEVRLRIAKDDTMGKQGVSTVGVESLPSRTPSLYNLLGHILSRKWIILKTVIDLPEKREGKPRGIPALRSLYNPNYRRFWLATALNYSAWHMLLTTLAWFMLQRTDSPLFVSLVYAVNLSPMAFLSPISGVIADRFNRKMVIFFSDVITLAVYLSIAILVFSDLASTAIILGVLGVGGVALAMGLTSRTAYVPNLVRREELSNALALTVSLFSLSLIVGPATAGFLISAFDVEPALFISSGLLIPSLMLFLSTHPHEQAKPSHGESFLRNLVEGFNYVRKSSVILALIFTGAVITIFAIPYQALMPVIARDELGVGSEGLGLLLGAAGVGALVSTLFLANWGETRYRHYTISLAGIGGGLFLIPFSLSPYFLLSLLLLFFAGFMINSFLTTNLILVQTIVPDYIRGRVLSMRMIIFGLIPVGQVTAGAASEVVGAPTTIAVSGALCALFMLILVLRSPEVRRI